MRIAIRDLATGKFWDGDAWVSGFTQHVAKLEQANGILSGWNLPLDFGDAKPAGLLKAWVWGLDWSSNYQPPDTVVFRLGDVVSNVTLVKPTYAQRFSGTVELNGVASFGEDRTLSKVDVRIRDVQTGEFWNGESFVQENTYLSPKTEAGRWNYRSAMPVGTYRVSVNGRDSDDEIFDVTHRLFHVDP